jgi:hypothetical protein
MQKTDNTEKYPSETQNINFSFVSMPEKNITTIQLQSAARPLP